MPTFASKHTKETGRLLFGPLLSEFGIHCSNVFLILWMTHIHNTQSLAVKNGGHTASLVVRSHDPTSNLSRKQFFVPDNYFSCQNTISWFHKLALKLSLQRPFRYVAQSLYKVHIRQSLNHVLLLIN